MCASHRIHPGTHFRTITAMLHRAYRWPVASLLLVMTWLLVPAVHAAMIEANLSWTVNFADPSNVYGLQVGDTIDGYVFYDSSLAADGVITSEEFVGSSVIDLLVLGFSAYEDQEIGIPGDIFPVLVLDSNLVLETITEILVPGDPDPFASQLAIISNDLWADFGRVQAGDLTVTPITAMPLPASLPLVLLGTGAWFAARSKRRRRAAT